MKTIQAAISVILAFSVITLISSCADEMPNQFSMLEGENMMNENMLEGENMMNEQNAIAWEERDGIKQATIRGMTVRLEDAGTTMNTEVMASMTVRESDVTGSMVLHIEDSTVPIVQMVDGTYYAETYQYASFEDLDELVHILVDKKIEHTEAAQ